MVLLTSDRANLETALQKEGLRWRWPASVKVLGQWAGICLALNPSTV
jgi:hypothetical protein